MDDGGWGGFPAWEAALSRYGPRVSAGVCPGRVNPRMEKRQAPHKGSRSSPGRASSARVSPARRAWGPVARKPGSSRILLHAAHRRKPWANSPCATPCPSRRPWRGAPRFPGDVGNGRRMEARQGPIRIFSRKAKVTGVQPLPRSLGEGSPRAARNERRRRRGRGPPRRRRGLLPATLRNSQADFAILVFFRHPIVLHRAPQPAIRLHLMRDPVNPSPRTTATGTRRPSRVPRIHKIAHQVFVKAQSGALPAGLFAGGCWG
jgi:hypothetical protein